MTAHCVRNSLQTAHIPWCSVLFRSPASLPFLSIHLKVALFKIIWGIVRNFSAQNLLIQSWNYTMRMDCEKANLDE